MMRLFIIQSISGFVSRDYDTGVHFLNEVKTHYAQNMSQLNPTLKGLAKEIIQSLDMLTPGQDASQFYSKNVEETPRNVQQEMSNVTKSQQKSEPTTVNSELSQILNRRKKKKKESKNGSREDQENDLFGDLGEMSFESDEEEDDEDYDVYDRILKRKLGDENYQKFKASESDTQNKDSLKQKLNLDKLKIEEGEDNAILEVLLKRKQKKGEISAEEEHLLDIINEKNKKKKEELEKQKNPIDAIKRKRERKDRDSSLWDE